MRAPTDDDLTTVALQRLIGGVLLIAVTVWLGIQVVVEADVNVDEWWNVFVDHFAALDPAALVMNFLGGGWFATFVVPLGGVALMLVLRRPRAALFVIVASVGSVAVVQLLKAVFGRARPEDMIVSSDSGSFPSGHTGNAATIAVIAVILFPRIGVALVGGAWVFAMAFSRTQVHAHWLSDTVGGALVGIGATLIIAAAFTRTLDRERERVGSLG